jgi:hypothetical protein
VIQDHTLFAIVCDGCASTEAPLAPTPDEATNAAVAAGWLITDAQDVCPACLGNEATHERIQNAIAYTRGER